MISGLPDDGLEVSDFLITQTPSDPVLVYRSDSAGPYELYSRRLHGGSEVRISGFVAPDGEITDFAISANGQHVVYLKKQTAGAVRGVYSVPILGGTELPHSYSYANVTEFAVTAGDSVVTDSSLGLHRASLTIAMDIFPIFEDFGDSYPGAWSLNRDRNTVVYVQNQAQGEMSSAACPSPAGPARANLDPAACRSLARRAFHALHFTGTRLQPGGALHPGPKFFVESTKALS